jgi:hypothetical protein
MGKQINISIPKSWLEQLERIARLRSVEEDRTMTHLDLMREAIQKEYKLTDEE